MAKPYEFKQSTKADAVNLKSPGKAAFIPLTNLAVQALGIEIKGPPYKMSVVSEECAEVAKELKPHCEFHNIVIVPCVLEAGVITLWAKKESDNIAFNSWVECMQSANGKPVNSHYDSEKYKFTFTEASVVKIPLPSLTQEDVFALIDRISIQNPESEEFAAILSLFD